MKYLLLALLSLSLLTSGFAQENAAPQEPIAVMDLKAEGVSQSVANVLSNKLRTELFNTGKYNVLNREDMKAILGEQEFQQSGMCDDMKCMAKIGGALGVIYMITGSIGKLGDTYNITLKMIDIEKIVNVRIVDETYSGVEDGLLIAIQNASRKITGRSDLLEYQPKPLPVPVAAKKPAAAPAPVISEGQSNYNRFSISRTQTGQLRQNNAVFPRGYFAGNLEPRVRECPEALRFVSMGKSQRGVGLPLGLLMVTSGTYFYIKTIVMLVNEEIITKQAILYFSASMGLAIPGGFFFSWGGENFNKAVTAFNNCMKKKYLDPPLAPAGTNAAGTVKELYDKAVTCIKNGQFKEAVEYSTKAITADSTFTKAYKSRGFANMQLKLYPQAAADLNKYLRIDSNSEKDFDQVRASIKSMGYVPDK